MFVKPCCKEQFCLECNKMVSTDIHEEVETHNFQGDVYTFLARSCCCHECGKGYFLVAEAHDYNLRTLQGLRFERHGILPPDGILHPIPD